MSAGVSLGLYEKALPPRGDWDAFFAQAAAAGASFVDLSVDESKARAARLEWSATTRATVREAARRQDVLIGAICLSLHRRVMPGSADPAVRSAAARVFRQAVDLAGELGVSIVQVAGYYAYYEPPDAAARGRYIDTLMAAVPYAARAGVILGIENVDGNDISSIPDALELVEMGQSPWLRLYPDVGNVAEHGGDVTEELRAGAGAMVALHLKDARPGEPRRVPFGEGDADFGAAFAELARQRWSGRMMLEMWSEDLPDAIEECVRAREFIEEKLAIAGIDVVGQSIPRPGTERRAS